MSTDTLVNPSLTDEDIVVTRPVSMDQAQILSPEALRFLADLTRAFRSRRNELLKLRDIRQREIDAGYFPDFLPETTRIRRSDWAIAPAPADLRDRRVEVSGPADPRRLTEVRTAGARSYVVDLQDALSPTWHNCVQAQLDVHRIVTDEPVAVPPMRTLTLMLRPRAWHLDETRVRVDNEAVPAALFDFALYLFHNAVALIDRGSGPYFYLSGLEGHLEARLWDDVFIRAQEALGLPAGTIRATALIETVLGAVEMDEILYELRDHCVALASDRWNYVLNVIKRLRFHSRFVLPDRELVSWDGHFVKPLCEMMVKTCHRRGAHAIGSINAPLRAGEANLADRATIRELRGELLREVEAGHDGTRVVHPALVRVAAEVFASYSKAPNQIGRQRPDVEVTAEELLRMPAGPVSEAGLRDNIRDGVRRLECWLRGDSTSSLDVGVGSAAGAEISRARVWQWLRHGAALTGGGTVDHALVRALAEEETEALRRELGDAARASHRFETAARLFTELVLSDDFVECIPTPTRDDP